MNVTGSKVNKKPNYHAGHRAAGGSAGGSWGCWSGKVMNGEVDDEGPLDELPLRLGFHSV